MISPPADRVQAAPFLPDARAYSSVKARADVVAGLTVAVFAIPQAMAYATLAGLPPVHGLYAAIGMSIVAALWGASPFSNAGPTNSAALLTASALLPFLAGQQFDNGALTALIFQFTLLVGVIRVVCGVLRLGILTAFVPESAIVGAMSGAGILIALGPLSQLLGVPSSHAASFVMRTWEVLGNSAHANIYALLIGASTCIVMSGFELWSKKRPILKRLPIALGAIILATIASQVLAMRGHGVSMVRDLGAIPPGLPPLQWRAYDWAMTPELLPGAFAVAIIGLIEATSIGRVLALKKRLTFNANQEFFGQGVGQIAGAFCGGLPGSSSFSRSALVENCGAQTRFANVFFGIFTLLGVLLAASWLERIPVAALAGLLVFSGFKLIDIGALKRVWQTERSDAIVLLVTLFVTVFVKIEYGFFAGTIVAMGFFLQRARNLQLFELLPGADENEGAGFDEIAYRPQSAHARSDVVALSVHGNLFFGLADDLRAQFNEIARLQKPRWVIIRVRRAHSIDYGCWNAIFEFAATLESEGGQLYLTGIREDLAQIIADAGMSPVLPPSQLIAPEEAPWAAFEIALERVRGQLPNDAHLPANWLRYFHPTHARFDT